MLYIVPSQQCAKHACNTEGNEIILIPRAHDPSGLWQGSRALAWSDTGSPRFTDPSNLIGREWETNALRILRKLGPARALDPGHRPEGSWALGTRMSSVVFQERVLVCKHLSSPHSRQSSKHLRNMKPMKRNMKPMKSDCPWTSTRKRKKQRKTTESIRSIRKLH